MANSEPPVVVRETSVKDMSMGAAESVFGVKPLWVNAQISMSFQGYIENAHVYIEMISLMLMCAVMPGQQR